MRDRHRRAECVGALPASHRPPHSASQRTQLVHDVGQPAPAPHLQGGRLGARHSVASHHLRTHGNMLVFQCISIHACCDAITAARSGGRRHAARTWASENCRAAGSRMRTRRSRRRSPEYRASAQNPSWARAQTACLAPKLDTDKRTSARDQRCVRNATLRALPTKRVGPVLS